MAKKKKGLLFWINWFVALFVGVGVGSLFVDGTFLTTIILEWFPTWLHTIVGWALIVGAVWEALKKVL